VSLAALIVGGRHDGHLADRLKGLRHDGEAWRANAVVVADQNAVRRGLRTLLCAYRREDARQEHCENQ
jgi:hypothetical protein